MWEIVYMLLWSTSQAKSCAPSLFSVFITPAKFLFRGKEIQIGPASHKSQADKMNQNSFGQPFSRVSGRVHLRNQYLPSLTLV